MNIFNSNLINEQRTENKLSLRKIKLEEEIKNQKSKLKSINKTADLTYKQFKNSLIENCTNNENVLDLLTSIVCEKDERLNLALTYCFELTEDLELNMDIEKEGWSFTLVDHLVTILDDLLNNPKNSAYFSLEQKISIYNNIIMILINLTYSSSLFSNSLCENKYFTHLNNFIYKIFSCLNLPNIQETECLFINIIQLLVNLMDDNYYEVMKYISIDFILNKVPVILISNDEKRTNALYLFTDIVFNSKFDFEHERSYDFNIFLTWVTEKLTILSNSDIDTSPILISEEIRKLINLFEQIILNWNGFTLSEVFLNSFLLKNIERIIINEQTQLENFLFNNNQVIDNNSFTDKTLLPKYINCLTLLINSNDKYSELLINDNYSPLLYINKMLSNFTKVFNAVDNIILENIMTLYISLFNVKSVNFDKDVLFDIFYLVLILNSSGLKNNKVKVEFIYLFEACLNNGNKFKLIENSNFVTLFFNFLIENLQYNDINLIIVGISVIRNILKTISNSQSFNQILCYIVNCYGDSELVEWMNSKIDDSILSKEELDLIKETVSLLSN